MNTELFVIENYDVLMNKCVSSALAYHNKERHSTREVTLHDKDNNAIKIQDPSYYSVSYHKRSLCFNHVFANIHPLRRFGESEIENKFLSELMQKIGTFNGIDEYVPHGIRN